MAVVGGIRQDCGVLEVGGTWWSQLVAKPAKAADPQAYWRSRLRSTGAGDVRIGSARPG
jgi:hypothetical protein